MKAPRWWPFVADLWHSGPWRVTGVVALLLAAGLTEGVSLLAFVPVLHLFQGDGAAQAGSAALVGPVLTALHVPLRLGPVLSVCAALVVARAVLVYAKSCLIARVHYGHADRLRLDLFRALGEAHWSCTGRLRAADLEETLTGSVGRVHAGVWAALVLVQAAVLGAVYLTLSALVSPTFTAVAALGGAALLVGLRSQRRRAAHLGAALNDDHLASFRVLAGMVQGLKTAKACGAEAAQTQRFATLAGTLRTGFMRYTDLAARSALVFQCAAAAGLAAAVYAGAVLFHLELPALLVLVVCAARLTPYLSQVQATAQQVLFALPAWEQLAALRAQLEAARELPAGDGPRFTLRAGIALDGVGVQYPGRAEPALCEVRAWLPAGRCTAVVGPSGAGKSTLADLLLGLITPDRGSIRVDGVPLDGAHARAWRAQVGYVPQDTFLLPGTVRENLHLGAPDAPDARLWAALEDAAAADFVRALPGGLDAAVGERGAGLSGGERQRLALARALLREPLLLVLDEATAALDAANEQRIGEVLARLRGRVTVVLIAHRSPLVDQADQVIELRAGRVHAGPAPVHLAPGPALAAHS